MPKGIGIALGIFAAALLANIVVGSVFAAILPQQIALIFTQFVAIGGLAYVFNKSLDQPQFPVQSVGVGVVGLFILCLCVVAIQANLIMAVAAELLPVLQENKEHYEKLIRELLRSESLALNICAGIAVALVAPFCEEWLFRGAMLQAQFRAGMGVWAAILLNGFLFSALHLNPIALLPLWIVGSLLAWSYWRTGSLLVPIIGHSALNTLNGVVLPILIWDQETPTEPPLRDLLLALLLFSAIVCGLLFVATRTFPRRDNV